MARWRAATPASGEADLVAAWRELGPRGSGALPIRCSRNGVLTVACSDAGRAQEVAADAERLLSELAHLTGARLVRLHTVVADHALRLPTFEAPTRPPAPSPAAQAAAADAAQGITAQVEDERLRSALAEAVAAALARRWDGNTE